MTDVDPGSRAQDQTGLLRRVLVRPSDPSCIVAEI